MSDDTERTELFDPEVRKFNFLIIEPNGALRRTLLKTLKGAGATSLIEAENAKDALMMLKANHNIDVIVCSEQLPDIHGIKLLNQIKQEKKFQETAVIMLFSDKDSPYIQMSLQIGADLAIAKPFPLSEMKNNVEEALANREKKLALRNLKVQLDVPIQILLGKTARKARCVELTRKDCQLVCDLEVGMGSRLQFQLPNPLQDGEWFEPIRGVISSVGRHQEGCSLAKIEFTAKPVKAQGVTTLLQYYMPKS
ncbi:response regulator [Deltaproteobacteria bacterium TL4]